MKHTLQLCAAVIILLWPCPFLGQARKPRLLSTESAASRIRLIQSKLAAAISRETLQVDKARHKQRFEQLKDTVTSFVITQLEAEPEIEWWQLRGQLVRILGIKYDDSTPDHFNGSPYVFRVLGLRKEDPIVWALCYEGDAFNGLGGSRAVVESYVVENGKARLAGRGGSEMDGYVLNAEQIWNPSPNSTSILTYGVLQWSSGHAPPAAAVLYGVSPAGTKTLWTFVAPGLQLMMGREPQPMLFAIEYQDEECHSQNLPSTAIDVYSVDHQIPYRVVHQFAAFQKP
jgi:hypothetical protein